jgi:hypothetical protein
MALITAFVVAILLVVSHAQPAPAEESPTSGDAGGCAQFQP